MSRNRAVQKIIPNLPDYLRPEERGKIPTDLIGSKSSDLERLTTRTSREAA